MITFCQCPFLLKEGQEKIENISTKIQEYSTDEMRLFYHFFGINRLLYTGLLENSELNCDNNIECIRGSIIDVINYLLDEGIDGFIIEKNIKNIRNMLYKYMGDLKNKNIPDGIEKINNAISFLKERAKVCKEYSFDSAYEIFKKTHVDKYEALCAIKMMLLAKDYFNIDKIYKLRERLLSTELYRDIMKDFVMLKKPPQNILSLFLSDYMLIEQIIPVINIVYYLDWDDDERLQYSFNFVCMLLYFRFILNIYILVGQCDTTGFFDEKRMEIYLSKIYHRINIIIYNYIYKSLSINEHIYFLVTAIFDDFCLHAQTSLDVDRLDKGVRLAGAIARTPARTEIDDIINQICGEAIKEWNDGSPLDHIDMIEFFKKKKKYACFFAKGSFEKRLNARIKKVCSENNIRRIRGIDIFVHKRKKTA